MIDLEFTKSWRAIQVNTYIPQNFPILHLMRRCEFGTPKKPNLRRCERGFIPTDPYQVFGCL